MSSSAAPNLAPTYGALYIGVLFAAFFQGVLTLQAYIYYESFPEDSWRLKCLVAIVWILDLVHLIFIGQATYYYLVTSWGNSNALQYTVWTFDGHLIVIGLATIMCQAFFLWRIWIFSNRSALLVTILACICLVTFGLDVYMAGEDLRTKLVSEFQVLAPEVTAVFSTGAGSDLIIALLLCYYLRRKESEFERTNSIISRLVLYAVTTGLTTSVLALACLITYFASPNTFIFIGIHFSLGRMYTNALLATLNSRRWLRGGRAWLLDTSSARKPIAGVSIHIETTCDGAPMVPPKDWNYLATTRDLEKGLESGEGEIQVVRDAFRTGFKDPFSV